MTFASTAQHAPRALLIDAAAVIAFGLLLVGLIACAVARHAGFGDLYVVTALVIYGGIGAFALAGLSAHGHPRFGIANIITTFRAVLTALIGAAILEPGILDVAGRSFEGWALASTALVALALDGIDGYAARRTGRASHFGMRYDMEVDALLVLFLSVLVYALGKAGAWVILIGAMRYLFLAAGALRPALAVELPVSYRRKAGCVYQIAALCIAIMPLAVPPVSNAIVLSALAFLVVSFTIDTVWLVRRAR